MRRTFAAAAAAAVAAAGLVAVAAPAAQAAPTQCNAVDAAIYTSPLGGVNQAPGSLIACRMFTLDDVVPGNIGNVSYKVQYASRNAQNQPIAVSGTVMVPTAAWTGGGTRPIIAFAPGTLGLGSQCALSKQLAGAYQDMYEGDNLAAFLRAGYAVAATDYVGYLNGQTHTYVVGPNAGHALLDAARAATQVPGAGLAAGTKIGISGYSEGGQDSLWGAQLAKSYAPELNVVGAAAGGVPGDLKLVASQLNGGPFAGFLADSAIGIAAAYPNLPFDALMNDTGAGAIRTAKTQCLLGTLANFLGSNIASFTKANLSLDQLYAQTGPDGVSWGQVLDAQKLGVDVGPSSSNARYRIGFPVLQFRGLLEEVIPTATTDLVRRQYCSAGIATKWSDLYPGEHLTTDSFAKDDVTAWFGDRFKGSLNNGANCPWI
jgi:hypothetical protein